MIFVNFPVQDLAASIRFYTTIGCEKNEQFSNDDAAAMVWSDSITFMLLTRQYFGTFTPKKVADAHASCEVLVAFSCDSNAAVDEINKKAGAAGGKSDIRELQDLGFMYSRAFSDPDGHTFEPFFMDMAAVANASQK
jgi:predicted lactoylglutathione lyase